MPLGREGPQQAGEGRGGAHCARRYAANSAGAAAPLTRRADAGQGESGKSTIFKQLKIIAARETPGRESFTREQREGTATTIVANMVGQMRILLGALLSSAGHELSPALQGLASRLLKLEEAEVNARDPEIGRVMQQLWDDPSVKRLYANRDHLLGTVNDGCG